MHHLHRLMLGVFQNLVPAHFEFFVEISANQNALIVPFVQEKEENRLILHPFQCCEFVESSRLQSVIFPNFLAQLICQFVIK